MSQDEENYRIIMRLRAERRSFRRSFICNFTAASSPSPRRTLYLGLMLRDNNERLNRPGGTIISAACSFSRTRGSR